MKNYQAIKIWDKVLKEYCHCYPDEVGNRPCDNGSWCTRCLEKDVQEIYRSLLKKEEEEGKKIMICKYCKSKVEADEEELWGHIQMKHEKVFDEFQDLETPDMIDICYSEN